MAEWILFSVLSAVAVVSAILMVVSRNPVHSALWLVLTFVCVAVFFLVLGAQFLFAVQIIVYTGAIMVLFLFVVMLLNLEREQEPMAPGIGRTVGIAMALLFLLLLAGVVVSRSGLPADAGARIITLRDLGLALYRDWLFPFELVSVLLLVAMVGSIVLARRRA